MADNDEDDAEAEAVLVPGAAKQRADFALPEICLKSALGSTTLRRIRAGKIRSVVVEVPTAGWVVPIVDALKRMFPWAQAVGISERSRQTRDGTFGGLIANMLTFGVSQNPRAYLAQALFSTADLSVSISPPTGKILAAVARRCLRGRTGSEFANLQITGLDFEQICACFPVGGSRSQSLERFRRAAAANSGSSRTDSVPDLSDAHGYGEAQAWALNLQRDLVDFRAGTITFEEIDKGAVLYGPPGTGKSLFARIVAKSCALPFYPMSVADLFQNAGDLGAVLKAQRAAFDEARAAAPALLFIDEIDAVPNRARLSPQHRDWWLPVVGDLLIQLDSAVSTEGLIVVGATNLIEQVDEALLRNGRLERKLWIGPPDAPALVGIMRFYLRGELADADLFPLAQVRQGATGADAREWVRAARRSARRAGRPLVLEDLSQQLLPPDTRSPEESRRVALHEAGHAVCATLLSTADVAAVSIVRGGNTGGQTTLSPSRRRLLIKSELEDQVIADLGGRAAEEVLLGGRPSNGAGGDESSDLAIATNLVAQWHVSLGMAEELTWRGAPDQTLTLITMDPSLRRSVNRDLRRLYREAKRLVAKNADLVEAVARALESKRNLSGDEFRSVLRAARPRRSILDPGDLYTPPRTDNWKP